MSDLRNSKKQKPYAAKLDISKLFDSDSDSDSNAEKSFSSKQFVRLEQIRRKPEQARRYFDPDKMQQLTESVKAHGILENLIVRSFAEKIGEYELVAGERRYRAAQAAGILEVPVVILELSDREAIQISLVENLQREDLNPVEETEGVLELLAIQLKTTAQEAASLLYKMQNESVRNVNHNVVVQENKLTVEKTFAVLGRWSWQSFVKHRIPLLNLPTEVLEALRQGKIAYTKAQAIARVRDVDERKSLLGIAISKNLSLAQIKEHISSLSTEGGFQKDKPVSLKKLMKDTYRLVEKSKVWEDPKKQKRLEKLLAEIEALISKS